MSCKEGHNHGKGRSAKRILGAVGLGQLAHFGLCPMHGLPALLMKVGVLGGSVAAPLVAAHDYLVKDVVTPIVSYFREDNTDSIYHEHNHENGSCSHDHNPDSSYTTNRLSNHDIAHGIVDYTGWASAIGLPAVAVYRHIRKKK